MTLNCPSDVVLSNEAIIAIAVGSCVLLVVVVVTIIVLAVKR